MPKEYSKEEAWKLYEKLPRELKEVVFAEETADNIYNVCERNGVKDSQTSEVARYTGRVLLGILPPEDFQGTLEKELKLGEETAKGVDREIFRLVFYPVKTSLEELYKTEIEPPARPSTLRSAGELPKVDSSKETELKEKSERKEKDIYRESVK